MPIRWKLILAIGTPLVLLLAGLLAYDYARLRATAHQESERRVTETADRYASSLDGDFRAIAQIARSTAQFLETAPVLSEPQLYDLLRRNVESDTLIYGSCVAFEPRGFPQSGAGPRPWPDHPAWQIPEAPGDRPRPNPELFCPYVYRGAQGLLRMDVADAYDYLDRRWEWYRVPRQTGKPFWTEPFFDEGAGNVEMVTYVTPFFREGKFAGTVDVDVRLERLRLRTLGRFTKQSGISVFVISREGKFIVAPTLTSPARETIFGLRSGSAGRRSPSWAVACWRGRAARPASASTPTGIRSWRSSARSLRLAGRWRAWSRRRRPWPRCTLGWRGGCCRGWRPSPPSSSSSS